MYVCAFEQCMCQYSLVTLNLKLDLNILFKYYALANLLELCSRFSYMLNRLKEDL